MTTSLSTSSSSRTLSRPAPFSLLVAALALAAGCSDGVEIGSCWDEVRPVGSGFPSDVIYRARISLSHTRELGAGGSSSSTVNAIFSDTTRGKGSSRELRNTLGAQNCFLLTGVPVQVCRPPHTDPCPVDYLEVDQVEVSQLAAGGPLTLARTSATSKGKYSAKSPPDPLFGSGEVKATVTGRQAKGYFPSFTWTLTPPDSVELLSPAADATVGSSDVKVSWRPGNGDVVLVDIAPVKQTGPNKDKVQCFAVDDGCQLVKAQIFENLDIRVGDQVRIAVMRVRGEVASVKDNHTLHMTATSRVEVTVTR